MERKLGGGGMGSVYLAHEVRLNRDVAIKVLRPELATAAAAESFLREAQILASIRHPNVIVIYRPDSEKEEGGLQYYIMELVNGPTLEDRLEAGPIPVPDAVGIGSDLLRGLETVHRLGLVHRDVKPSNVFVLPDRALLGDFGIARPPFTAGTDAHGPEGTPEYMAPEQVEGKPITLRTDIYSTGVVLYEAVTGRRFHEQGKQVDWSGVPSDLARVVRRAVAEKPEERWPDAAAFRKALERMQAPGLIRRVAPFAAGGLIVGAVILLTNGGPPPPPSNSRPTVAFNQIEYTGPADRRPMADSLVHMVHSDLRPHLNFVDSTPRGAGGALAVQARMTVTGGDVAVRLTGAIPASEFQVPLELWPALRDSLDYQIVLGVWAGHSPLAGSLPARALPHRSEGLIRFLEAERLVAQEQWEKADSAYRVAEATDTTCWICSWRILEIGRWRSRQPDPARVRRVQVHADSLPPLYRSLIRAAQLPLRDRLDTLRAAAEGSREFFLGWFQLGDELFHRGPLAGHRRSEAIPAFERAARLRPDFRPSWEHLAWAATAEGDSGVAASALDSLESRSAAPDPFSLELRALLKVGFAWRFLPEQEAARITAEISGQPATQSSADFGAGPRMLPTFDVPRGAIALGEILEHTASPDWRRSGLIAQTLGAVALGRLDRLRDLTHRLTEVAPESELVLFNAELPAALAYVDSGSIRAIDALDDLSAWTLSSGVDPLRDRAVWMSSLLGHRTPPRVGAPGEFELFIAADSLAAAGHPRAALVLLDPIDVDAVARRVGPRADPFFRAIVHLKRAAWRAQIGDIERARSELLWHEHLDVVALPTGLPQAAEVDWAFGTLARWRLARLLDRAGRAQRGEACEAYAAVVRHWSEAPAPYGARADTARTRARALNCASTR
ncbi:MAG TPA: serine/threonine-protein kinase [Gemmatimonadales bacterium]|nr:serine/threonine-protein kinase [Gemmatimonadales bacterium]